MAHIVVLGAGTGAMPEQLPAWRTMTRSPPTVLDKGDNVLDSS